MVVHRSIKKGASPAVGLQYTQTLRILGTFPLSGVSPFLINRLLAKLSQCAWRVLSSYLKQGVHLDSTEPGAVIAVQTFGDFLNFNPHLHIMAPDGCWGHSPLSRGVSPYLILCVPIPYYFIVGPEPDLKDLEDAFRLEVLKMLKAEGKINDSVIENMLGWYNSGFNVYCSNPIGPSYHDGIERLAQYIIRAPISQERMKYVPAEESPDGVASPKLPVKSSAKIGHASFRRCITTTLLYVQNVTTRCGLLLL